MCHLKRVMRPKLSAEHWGNKLWFPGLPGISAGKTRELKDKDSCPRSLGQAMENVAIACDGL